MPYLDLVNFSRTFAALDIELPTEFDRAVAVLAAGMTAASANPSYELLSKFDTGELTPETVGPEVLRAAVALNAKQSAHGIMRDIENPLCKHARNAIRGNGDELVDQLRPVFDSAAVEVATAAEMFTPTATAADILRSGPGAAVAWNSLADAAARLAKVHDARLMMANFGYGASPHRPAYFVEGIGTQDQMIAAVAAYGHSSGRGGRFHALVVAGVTLRLNDAHEVAAIDAAVQSDVSAITAGRQAGPRMSPEAQAGAEKELRIRGTVPVPVPMKARA